VNANSLVDPQFPETFGAAVKSGTHTPGYVR